MRRYILSMASAALLAATAVTTLPMASSATAAPLATPVAAGCGMGRTRDAMGRCHHPFNRFDHHRRFKAYKSTHCKPLRTPNGVVGFCKV